LLSPLRWNIHKILEYFFPRKVSSLLFDSKKLARVLIFFITGDREFNEILKSLSVSLYYMNMYLYTVLEPPALFFGAIRKGYRPIYILRCSRWKNLILKLKPFHKFLCRRISQKGQMWSIYHMKTRSSTISKRETTSD